MNEIQKEAYTNGEHFKIGKLYGFDLLVKTEVSKKEGLDFKENRFFIEGEGNIKYTFNNGHVASDPKLASLYFLNALEKIPKIIEKYQTESEKISKDLPILQEVVNSTWRKESELKDLKTELAALDRKIQLSLKPIEGEEISNERSTSVGEPNRELSVYTPSLNATYKDSQNPKEVAENRGVAVCSAKGVRL